MTQTIYRDQVMPNIQEFNGTYLHIVLDTENRTLRCRLCDGAPTHQLDFENLTDDECWDQLLDGHENNFEYANASDLGALSEAPTLTTIIDGCVFFYRDYQIRSAIDELWHGGTVELDETEPPDPDDYSQPLW